MTIATCRFEDSHSTRNVSEEWYRFAVDLVSAGPRGWVGKAAPPCLPSEAQGGHPRQRPE